MSDYDTGIVDTWKCLNCGTFYDGILAPHSCLDCGETAIEPYEGEHDE